MLHHRADQFYKSTRRWKIYNSISDCCSPLFTLIYCFIAAFLPDQLYSALHLTSIVYWYGAVCLSHPHVHIAQSGMFLLCLCLMFDVAHVHFL